MANFIDFARLEAPLAIEALDYEAQLAAAQAKLIELLPEWDVADIESDPANKVMEVAAYLDLLLRGRVNDAVKSMLLAYATGTNLDQLGTNVNAERLAGETDDRFRARVQTAMWAHTAVGNPVAYRWHAMSVSTDVVDVAVAHNSPGRVDVVVLAVDWEDPNLVDAEEVSVGAALFPDVVVPAGIDASWVPVLAPQSSPTHDLVRVALAAEDVAPLTDEIAVMAPVPVEVAIIAELSLYPGPDSDVVLADALEALQTYLLSIRHPGYDCTRAGILDALVVSGVRAVDLTAPGFDVSCTSYEVAAATDVILTVAETRDV